MTFLIHHTAANIRASWTLIGASHSGLWLRPRGALNWATAKLASAAINNAGLPAHWQASHSGLWLRRRSALNWATAKLASAAINNAGLPAHWQASHSGLSMAQNLASSVTACVAPDPERPASVGTAFN